MKTFKEYVDDMGGYLTELKEMQPLNLTDLKVAELPQAGIYVLYEHRIAQYVGRTGRMKARLKEHGHKSSNHFSASFAFILAKNLALSKGIDCNRSRITLAADPDFKFKDAKKAVSLMQFRFVKIEDSIAQTLFEVYASLELKTLHNTFDPH